MDRDIDSILESPVFIVGAPRSGTTWVQRLLLSHPSICGGQESSFFELFGPIVKHFKTSELRKRSGRRVGMPCYWRHEDITQEVWKLWSQTFRSLIEDKPSARFLVEKTPQHALVIEEIVEVLPRARFIHVIRDSRAVVASLLAASRDDWGRSWAPSSARAAAQRWKRYVSSARSCAHPLGNAYTEIHYEDLKLNPTAEVARLFSFLGIDTSLEVVATIVKAQDFERQQALGGMRLAAPSSTEDDGTAGAEPHGFFRRGEIDGWRRELSLLQQAIVWSYTRPIMREVGYTWRGRSLATLPHMVPDLQLDSTN